MDARYRGRRAIRAADGAGLRTDQPAAVAAAERTVVRLVVPDPSGAVWLLRVPVPAAARLRAQQRVVRARRRGARAVDAVQTAPQRDPHGRTAAVANVVGGVRPRARQRARQAAPPHDRVAGVLDRHLVVVGLCGREPAGELPHGRVCRPARVPPRARRTTARAAAGRRGHGARGPVVVCAHDPGAAGECGVVARFGLESRLPGRARPRMGSRAERDLARPAELVAGRLLSRSRQTARRRDAHAVEPARAAEPTAEPGDRQSVPELDRDVVCGRRCPTRMHRAGVVGSQSACLHVVLRARLGGRVCVRHRGPTDAVTGALRAWHRDRRPAPLVVHGRRRARRAHGARRRIVAHHRAPVARVRLARRGRARVGGHHGLVVAAR